MIVPEDSYGDGFWSEKVQSRMKADADLWAASLNWKKTTYVRDSYIYSRIYEYLKQNDSISQSKILEIKEESKQYNYRDLIKGGVGSRRQNELIRMDNMTTSVDDQRIVAVTSIILNKLENEEELTAQEWEALEFIEKGGITDETEDEYYEVFKNFESIWKERRKNATINIASWLVPIPGVYFGGKLARVAWKGLSGLVKNSAVKFGISSRINGYKLTGHAWKRFKAQTSNRDFKVSGLEKVLKEDKKFSYFHNNELKTGFYDKVQNIFISTSKEGNILTIIRPKSGEGYINNLKNLK